MTSRYLQFSFKTSDGITNHVGGGTKTMQHTPRILTEILEYHFDEFKEVHRELEDSMKQTNFVLKQQELLHNRTVILTINGQQVTYHSLLYLTASIILVINLLLVINYWRYRSQNEQKRYHTSWINHKRGRSGYSTEAIEGNQHQTRLLKTANELETTSISSRRSYRRPRHTSHLAIRDKPNNSTVQPPQAVVQYTVVPTILDD